MYFSKYELNMIQRSYEQFDSTIFLSIN